ncbi:hypothetical protein [Cryptosporangium aurantiacum]|uniref:Uncharacterized protein n=1 Tax=Cryptosporangium aurantiacum TaxID=134849 RepID=A0A1M7RJH9_9ACTN|nr:hypothetical protein [Cryptosporangium aurantiacum]SHN46463.1 hypothetical protein SAMN05443668_115152 [Cryptosporangium aurantiacum]
MAAQTGQNVLNETTQLTGESPFEVGPRLTESVIDMIMIDLSRPPSPRERARLDTRLRRLYDAEESHSRATTSLMKVGQASSTNSVVAKSGSVRVRDTFVARSSPAPGEWSDRKLPAKEDRPPSAQLVTPRGAGLRLELIALFEAQTHTKTGARPENRRPLKASGDEIGWADFLATDATDHNGNRFMTVANKKARQLYNAIDLMHRLDLVSLPNGTAPRNKHAGFLLNNESGKRAVGPNDLYEVPGEREGHFLLPVELFTHGWINVLEDRELQYLLMLSYFHSHSKTPEGFRVPSDFRVGHMGLGPDTYETHKWFSRYELNHVTMDIARHANGTVDDYGDGGAAIPHTLQLLPEGLRQDAFRVVATAIEKQLERPSN